MPARAVFTIATGKPVYLTMAVALARSFRLWHRSSDIRFCLATDRERAELPADLADLDLVRLETGQFGFGFTPKLSLDLIAPAEQSLFIDADSLCVGSLEPAFAALAGHAVSVIGREITDGGWSGADVAGVCRRFGIPALTRFNGGLYYLEPGAACTRVYETARELLPRYDEIGFERLRGACNEEPIMALAMALCGQQPIAETGAIMNTIHAAPGGLRIDVLRGRAVLRNPPGHPRHNAWYLLDELHPVIVHFCGWDPDRHPYRAEMAKLRLVCAQGWPRWLARLWVWLFRSLPARLLDGTKRWLRPVLHGTVGPRRQRLSSRV